MSDDLSEIKQMSKDIGPRKVKTPQVESEQFDPVTVLRARNLLASRNFRVSITNMTIDIAVPKDNRCNGCGS